jgi:hypothetical protein
MFLKKWACIKRHKLKMIFTYGKNAYINGNKQSKSVKSKMRRYKLN